MSTAELSINTWVQSENTLDYGPAWPCMAEQQPVEKEIARRPVQHHTEREPEVSLPEGFWQDWFGLWS